MRQALSPPLPCQQVVCRGPLTSVDESDRPPHLIGVHVEDCPTAWHEGSQGALDVAHEGVVLGAEHAYVTPRLTYVSPDRPDPCQRLGAIGGGHEHALRARWIGCLPDLVPEAVGRRRFAAHDQMVTVTPDTRDSLFGRSRREISFVA